MVRQRQRLQSLCCNVMMRSCDVKKYKKQGKGILTDRMQTTCAACNMKWSLMKLSIATRQPGLSEQGTSTYQKQQARN